MTKTKRNGGMFGTTSSNAQTGQVQKNNQSVVNTQIQTNKPVANPVVNQTERPWYQFWGGKRRRTKKGGFTTPSTSSVTGVAAGAKMSCKQALGIASSKCKGGSKRRKSKSVRRKKRFV